MASPTPQTFENHVRFVPAYHFVAFGILAINLIWSIIQLVKHPSGGTVVTLLMAIGIVIIWFYARMFPMMVQDRLIRLETTLRLEKLLPLDLRPRIKEFTLAQLIAIRFASDEELPALAARVLQEKITSGKEIKRMVKNWNPDYMRI